MQRIEPSVSESSYVIISQAVTDRENIASIANKWEVAYNIRIFTFDLGTF